MLMKAGTRPWVQQVALTFLVTGLGALVTALAYRLVTGHSVGLAIPVIATVACTAGSMVRVRRRVSL